MTKLLPPAAGDAELAEVIASGAAQLQVEIDPARVSRLVAYLHLIEHWNATYNLTAVRNVHVMATQHIVDSLSAIPTLRRLLRESGRSQVLDVGSGAGLPGVVMAIVDPHIEVTCVDSVGKKVAFIIQASGALALRNLSAVHGRVEAMSPPPAYDVVVSRAFASLTDFVTSTRHLLSPGGWWMAMKGKVPHQELMAAEHLCLTLEVEPLEVPGLDAERCLVLGQPK